ncbi:SEC14 cytosolic factor [Ananas comosus]|uniref:SEC14 cytosolic factor n=1 Tax=Ananas comosus TaxID=4615 RepID=A0A199W2J8_ANACO|nr:SEC14 cytosolic factor [Ananas comosus]
MALAQMRDLLQNMGSSSQSSYYGDDETLLRFLRAKSMSPEKAAKMFADWEKWRVEIAPSGSVDEAEIAAEFEARKAYLQRPTKDGHPLVILQACKHFAPKDQLEFKKFVAYMLDKTIASGAKEEGGGSEKMVVIIDLQHLGLKNLDANGFLIGFQYLQSYYPEQLEKLYILSMPWIFIGIWKMISAFLEKAILEKVVIVNNDAQKKEMIKEIGEEALPEDYGGLAQLTPIQDVKLSHWPTKN